ncbi:MAG: transcription-repair coupling factor (superfamily II helicase), partial [Verrucomicrobiales bacterium]
MSKKRMPGPNEASSCRALVQMPGLARLATAVTRWPRKSVTTLDQIAEPAQAFWITWLLETLAEQRPEGGTLWVLCRDVTQQDRLANELPIWSEHPILYFPQHDAVHFEGALPDPETASERLQTLHTLGRPADQWRAVLLHHESMEETVPAPGSLEREEMKIEVGSEWDLQKIALDLEEADFDRVPQVFERGQYAQRGGILDIFSWQATDPVRIEFFDREVESIRVFDIDAQTSVRQLERTSLLLKDSGEAFGKLAEYIEKKDRTVAMECGEDEVANTDIRFTEFATKSTSRAAAWTSTDGPLGDFHAGDFVLQEARRQQFTEQLDAWATKKWKIRMYFNNRGEVDRFKELVPGPALEKAGVEFCEGRLAKGFTIPGAKLAVLTDAEIFGRYQHGRTQRLFKRVSRQRKFSGSSDFTQFQPDDYVVHAEYGIGRYEDIEKRESQGVTEEVLVIEYADDSRLYVPLEHAHLVSRFVGVGRSAPKLSKLGSGRWMKVKKATERAIMDYAGELLKLQASRQTYQGITHSEDTKWQWEFENAFIYKETRDQLTAIHETKTNMESNLPMDRLICGDVGFGKTEVAIRAAFKAVMSGYQ